MMMLTLFFMLIYLTMTARQSKRSCRRSSDAKYHSIVPAPVMSLDAFHQLMESKVLAGHHAGKDRGTFQSTTLDVFDDSADALGTFVSEYRKWAANDGYLINDFANINGGRGAPKQSSGVEKDAGRENGAFHKDNPSEGPQEWPNAHRVLPYS